VGIIKTKTKKKYNSSDLRTIILAISVLIIITLFAINLDKIFVVDIPEDSLDFLNSRNLSLENITGIDEDYKVNVILFMDYYCPYCVQEFEVVEQLREIYNENVNFVVKHYPSHEGSIDASLAVECVKDQDLFWNYSKKIFLSSYKPLSNLQLKQLALEQGLDMQSFEFCFDNRVKSGVIQSHIQQAQNLGVRGTPTMYVNDFEIVGYKPVEQVRKIIDTQLEELD
jgi:protein-disulfide isomerase